MITLLSPAKTLDYLTPTVCTQFTMPHFLSQSSHLIDCCRKLSVADLQQRMKISLPLAELTLSRFQNWHHKFTLENARQALFAFKGDVYEGLHASDFSNDDLQFAQKTILILSGLYGLLKPLDLMQPYRLEMGTALVNSRGKNLYQFWRELLTDYLKIKLAEKKQPSVINLASEEYFNAICPEKLDCPIIKPVFLDEKNDQFKVISFYAKKARGLMARYIIKHKLVATDDLKKFTLGGYHFSSIDSNEAVWVFKRSAKAAQQLE